jgi:molybdopterin-containing oxidoreductase family iron-sulfur binding subunit
MPSLNEEQHPYWRGLAERAQSPEALASLEREFAALEASSPHGMPRRDFLKMIAAALSVAGLSLSGCRRWPEQQVRPHTRQPEGTAPGVPQHYATLFELSGVATGILAKTIDGRPIKIEGNSLHPFSNGAADAFAQASVLDLYDPERSRPILQRSGGEPIQRRWEDFQRFANNHFARLRTGGGQGLAVLSRPTCGPTLLRLKREFLKTFPRATWHVYEPLHRDHEIAGARFAFGKPLRPQYHLDKARIIACFDADLLGLHPAHQRHASDWAVGRASGDQGRMNRLYVAESTYSITGSVADHRLPVRPSRVMHLLAALAAQVGAAGSTQTSLDPAEQRWVRQLAADIKQNRGTSVVAVGPGQPPEVHALAHVINAAIAAHGGPLIFTPEPMGEEPGCIESIRDLAQRMRAGQVSTLLVLDGNPVYDAPADLAFDPAGPPGHPILSIHLSAYDDETSARCRWRLPLAHYLECWGDGRAWDGTYSVQQPLILPLFSGKSPAEFLATILGLADPSGLALVQTTAKELIDGSFQEKWDRLLHDGLLAGSAWPAVVPDLKSAAPPVTPAAAQGLEIVFTPDASMYDGRFANNAWLQELPDPLTKLTWDNAALIAKYDADQLGVTTGDVVKLSVGGRELEIPVYVMPGQPAGVLAIPLGYGRTHGGHIGRGVGANVYLLRTSDSCYVASGATLAATGRHAPLAATQEHHLIDAIGMWGREQRVGEKGKSGHLIKEASLGEYQHDPHIFAEHEHDSHQLFDPPSRFNDPHAWAMAIDLNKCIGCSACIVACQAENNIPVVGKEQVAKKREMHWLRIDRYFKGPVDNPDVVHAPMACSHCENAPCEQVCPVAATVHDAEGLNTMVYNRCVGTRYCSNNCPYKVRRFNYFDFHATDPRGKAKPWIAMPDQQLQQVDPLKRMVFNPDVTVRMRGVMEKCTYCVQRIQAAKIAAKLEYADGARPDDRVHDGQVVTACQGACPTQAIVFGDRNDPASRVSQAHSSPRAYVMLEQLNLRVRTHYLAKLRNPASGENP